MLTVIILSIIVVGLFLVGLGIKMLINKNAEFKKTCGSVGVDGKKQGCSCQKQEPCHNSDKKQSKTLFYKFIWNISIERSKKY